MQPSTYRFIPIIGFHCEECLSWSLTLQDGVSVWCVLERRGAFVTFNNDSHGCLVTAVPRMDATQVCGLNTELETQNWENIKIDGK